MLRLVVMRYLWILLFVVSCTPRTLSPSSSLANAENSSPTSAPSAPSVPETTASSEATLPSSPTTPTPPSTPDASEGTPVRNKPMVNISVRGRIEAWKRGSTGTVRVMVNSKGKAVLTGIAVIDPNGNFRLTMPELRTMNSLTARASLTGLVCNANFVQPAQVKGALAVLDIWDTKRRIGSLQYSEVAPSDTKAAVKRRARLIFADRVGSVRGLCNSANKQSSTEFSVPLEFGWNAVVYATAKNRTRVSSTPEAPVYKWWLIK